ncbi:hypothetical protein [Kibdelosporangium phytohabitans]|uniref:hypothetical protein n=1 Tax=Kibdelosporangium phytohabitans TaxID=860235 RepID=UPI0012FC4E50|nr:hypothetical protein [Kibdelosporangium phytohabitans]MBE1467031.1 putative membrane protein [Kibdelosporangium phytohabitans]
MKMRISGGDTDAPSVIRVSFWAWIAAAAIGLIDAVLFFYFKNTLIDSTMRARPDLNVDQVRSGANSFVWLTLILAVLFGSLYAYFGYRMRAGERKARTRLMIAGVVHLVVSILFPVSLIVLIGVVLSLVGVLAMYLPAAAKTYFTDEV